MSELEQVRAAGVLCFRTDPEPSFLLMRHTHRYDMPKGHQEEGETDLECALRELEEETGIRSDQLTIDPEFTYDIVYYPRYRRTGGKRVHKTVVFFIGHLKEEIELKLTEHVGFEWLPWKPPHHIQTETVDELLHAAYRHFDERPDLRPW